MDDVICCNCGTVVHPYRIHDGKCPWCKYKNNMKKIEDKSFLKTYDWEAALGFADFSADCIENVIAYDDGFNDGDSWVLVAELKDGRFGYVDAWCDYTGWDCQSGGSSEIAESFEKLQRFHLTSQIRRRLDIVLEDLDSTPTQY